MPMPMPTLNEDDAEKRFSMIYDEIVEVFGHNGLTWSDELEEIGASLIPNFVGVFSSDTVPILHDGESAIVNTSGEEEPGEHWICAFQDGDKSYFWDSFGRPVKKIAKKLITKGRVYNADLLDSQQSDDADNCGQLCVTWLMFVNEYGIENGRLI